MRARALIPLLLMLVATAASGAPATAFRVTLPPLVPLSQDFSFTVEAVDASGMVDPTYQGRIVFSSNDFIATLPPPYSFNPPTDAGVHVFGARLHMLGDHSITASQIDQPTIRGTGSTEVKRAPYDTQQFALTRPAGAVLGTPFDITITAVDENFAPTGNFIGTLEVVESGFTDMPNITFTAEDNGVKTISVTPDRGGPVVFVVRDLAYPAVSGAVSLEVSCPGFTVTASNDGPVCPFERPTLTATTSVPDVQFDWRGRTFVFEAHGAVVQGSDYFAGTYIVTMSLPNGCSAFAETTVIRNSDDTQFSVDGPTYACDGVDRTISIVDGNGPYSNIHWSATHGTVVSGQGTTSIVLRGDYDESGPANQFTRVNFSATNGAGCVIDQRYVIEFEVFGPPPPLTIDTPSSACAGQTQTARALTSGDASVQWSITNGTILQNLGDRIDYSVSGTGDTVISATASNGQCSSTKTATVSSTGPTATIASDAMEICAGDSVAIPVTLSGAPPFSVFWSDGRVDEVNTSTFTRSVTPDGDTSYAIDRVSDAHCSGNAIGHVDVITRGTPAVTLQPKNAAVAKGASAALRVEVAPDATHVQWYRGASGDRSQPVLGANALVFRTPAITQNTSFWAEIITACGTTRSNAAAVSLEARRRAARHP